jgi:hypothetical protein
MCCAGTLADGIKMPIVRGEIYVEIFKDTQKPKEDAATLNEFHNTISPIGKEVQRRFLPRQRSRGRARYIATQDWEKPIIDALRLRVQVTCRRHSGAHRLQR